MIQISQGAEAVIIRDDDRIIKKRVKKSYRIQQIDEKLRLSRTRKESRLLREAIRVGVPVPHVIETKKYDIIMDFIDGVKLRDIIENNHGLAGELGKLIAVLHERNIIHGDITTSNALFSDGKLYLIDFGLGSFSFKTEDKAVDLWLLKEVLESSHSEPNLLWKTFLKGYEKHYKDSKKVIRRLEEIQKRGRYRKR